VIDARERPASAARGITGIENEAKQSGMAPRLSGLLRRFAPRNDGLVIASEAKQSRLHCGFSIAWSLSRLGRNRRMGFGPPTPSS
jgi:hypothetical protein